MQVVAIENFRINLRAIMESRELSQRELATAIHAGYPHINRILQGKADPTIPMADRIADHFGLDLCDLLKSPRAFAREHIRNQVPAA